MRWAAACRKTIARMLLCCAALLALCVEGLALCAGWLAPDLWEPEEQA